VIVILPENQVEIALDYLHHQKYGKEAAVIGKVTAMDPGKVLIHTVYGSTRMMLPLSGEMLPRIC
jgi:hydrogenase expression/formation protein HypE